MASCSHCENKFRFTDVLKSLTPWAITCSSCQEKITSSFATTAIAFIGFIAFCWFTYDYLLGIGLGFTLTCMLMLTAGLIMEIIWYTLLSRGVISSNLRTKNQ